MLRRSPTLWTRSPIRRSSRSALHSSRCFSKSGHRSARHNDESDNNGGKKPDITSDPEWMRQRHLRRWRKRIEEDPYRALFGASEEMLRGRGLEGYIERQREMHRKGLQWVEKMFPKWMLEDMGLRGRDTDQGVGVKEEYPKKVNIDTVTKNDAKERQGVFRQPSYRTRTSRFEKNLYNEGVESPSDSRRPREQPLNASQQHDACHEDIRQTFRKDTHVTEEPVSQEHAAATTQEVDNNPSLETTSALERNAKDATSRETSFIEEFLADRSPTTPPNLPGNVKNKDWRQTALERRAMRDYTLKPRRNTDVPVVDVTAKYSFLAEVKPETKEDTKPTELSRSTPVSKTHRAVVDFHGLSSSRLGRKEVEQLENSMEETSDKVKTDETLTNVVEGQEDARRSPRSKFSPYPRINTDDWVITPDRKPPKEIEEFADVKVKVSSTKDLKFGQSGPNISTNARRSASDVLKQLPKDDLDLLTADDVRTSMGHMKGNHEDKAAIRKKLEEEFSKDNPEIDSMLEANIVNDRYVRRKASELSKAEEPTLHNESKPSTVAPEQKPSSEASEPPSVLEASLDYMSRWLHNGGNVLAQHFWQDPVQLVAGQISGADEQFLKGIGIGVLKGRRAFASVKDELVEDIPAARELVNRLNRDEIKATAGAVRLYRELPSGLKDTSDADASKIAAHKRIGQLRQALMETDQQFKKACESVDNMKDAAKPSFLQEKRLRFANDVLRKNAKLTRMAVFGLQAHIEVEAGTPGGLVARELLHRLLTLQDTQLALSRLLSRSMQVMGINPKAEEEVSTKNNESTVDLSDPSIVEALASVATKHSPSKKGIDTAAARQRLEDEVAKQKAAMRGLSDDGYKRPPKSVLKKSFERPNPLAHSLFRPFGLQLNNLGKDVDATEDNVVKAAERKKDDKNLVKEIRKAYEDAYGAITVDHRQVTPAEPIREVLSDVPGVPEVTTSKRQPSLHMLKEDEVSPALTYEAPTAVTDSTSISKDYIAATKSPAGVEAKKEVNDGPAKIEDVRHSSTSDTDPSNRNLSSPLETTWVEPSVPIANCKETNEFPASSTSTGNEHSYDSSTNTYVPISYKTLIYNAETDSLSITTSQVPQPNPLITPIPLHEALATLSHPAKLVDHLPESFHVIQVKPDVLSVRTASPSNTTAEKTVVTTIDKTNAEPKSDAEEVEGWKGINPVDGTTTLSPTGFEGVGSDLDREVDFAERRRKADEYHKEVNKSKKSLNAKVEKKKGRVGVGGVVKTAIWAGAFCYIVGVAAEVAKVPF